MNRYNNLKVPDDVGTQGKELVSHEPARTERSLLWTGKDPDQVGVWPRIFRVNKIDPVEQSVSVNLVLIVNWLDPAFAADHARPGQKDNRGYLDNANDCPTRPCIIFHNMVSDEFRVTMEFMWVNPQGVCHWERWGTLSYVDSLEAQNFPFDYADFNLCLRLKRDFQVPDRYFCTIRSNQNEYNQNRIHINVASNIVPEWQVCSFDGKEAFHVIRDSMTVTPMLVNSNLQSGWDARYNIYFVLKRKSQYYMTNVWSLTVLINVLAITNFSLGNGKDDLADRQALIITLLLVQVAVKFAFTDSIPKVPYLTTLDLKVYISTLMLGILLILVSVFPHVVKEDDLDHYNLVLLCIWMGSVCLVEGVLCILPKLRERRQKAFLEGLAAEQFPGCLDCNHFNLRCL